MCNIPLYKNAPQHFALYMLYIYMHIRQFCQALCYITIGATGKKKNCCVGLYMEQSEGNFLVERWFKAHPHMGASRS